MCTIIEQGDIGFFYRRKMDVDKPRSVDDLMRFYLLLMPDGGAAYRLFIVGRKQMPEIIPGESESTERGWAINLFSDRDAAKLREALGPIGYETETKGRRREAAAVPTAQGRYGIIELDGNTQLACRIEDPGELGRAQSALNIEQFAKKRWIDVTDPELLDYENTQILLVGAADRLDPVELEGEANLFERLEFDPAVWPTESLKHGRFTGQAHQGEAVEAEADRSKGGRRGGKAALDAPSAAGIAKALKGIDLPGQREDLVRHAREHDAGEPIIETLEKMPERTFKTMADVEKALGEIR